MVRKWSTGPISLSYTTHTATARSPAVEAQGRRLAEEARLAGRIIPSVLRELLAAQQTAASDESYVAALEAEVRSRLRGNDAFRETPSQCTQRVVGT